MCLQRMYILLLFGGISVNVNWILLFCGGVNSPLPLLVFCPVALPAAYRVTQNCPPGAVRWPVSPLHSVSVSCILKSCMLVHTHLEMLSPQWTDSLLFFSESILILM